MRRKPIQGILMGFACGRAHGRRGRLWGGQRRLAGPPSCMQVRRSRSINVALSREHVPAPGVSAGQGTADR
jgi:hypothetical protein